LEKVLR